MKNKSTFPMFATLRGTLYMEGSKDSVEIVDSWYWHVDYPPSFYMGPFASREEAQKDWDRTKGMEHNFNEQDVNGHIDLLSNCVFYEKGEFYKGSVKISLFKSKSMEFEAI